MIDFDHLPAFRQPALIAVIYAPRAYGELVQPALKRLGGKSLLAWSLDCAQGASSVNEIVVVTDDAETALAAGRLGRGHKPVRVMESHLALTPMSALQRAVAGRDIGDANICLLHVASPLRASWDIDAAANVFMETLARRDESRPLSLTSVASFPNSPDLNRLRWVVRDGALDGRLGTIRSGVARQVFAFGHEQSQVPNAQLCSLNEALTLLTPQTLRQWLAQPEGGLPAQRLAYIMPDERSLEVECEQDLLRAKAILGVRQYTTVIAPPLCA